MLLADDLVILKNHENRELRFRHDGKLYVVPKKASVHIAFAIVCKEFGDPRSGEKERIATFGNGEKLRLPSRAQEVERMKTWWGVSAKAQEDRRPVEFHEMVPKVTITGPDGEAIKTVVEDPGGEHAAVIPISADTPEALEARVASLQAQMDSINRQLKATEREAPEGLDEVPEDSPVGAGV